MATSDRHSSQKSTGKAVNQLPKSVVREIRTPRSVGAGGGRPPPATRFAPCKRVEDCRLRWRPRQSLASSCEPSLAWRPVTAVAKRRQGGCRPERSERENSPEIDRDRSSRPYPAKGKAESQPAL